LILGDTGAQWLKPIMWLLGRWTSGGSQSESKKFTKPLSINDWVQCVPVIPVMQRRITVQPADIKQDLISKITKAERKKKETEKQNKNN
jgi:hypothetical protein